MEFEQLGPYRIGRKLGRGGMGTVFEGLDPQTGQRVAVKVLSPNLAQEEGFRERFELEIESLKKLRHPGIVRLYGYGEQDGHLFYSMELVDGTNLEDELRAGRRFSWREVTRLSVELCRALKHAHDHGVIHRDLKPANLLLTPDGQIKLTDFGIARLFGQTHLTGGGGVLGTAEYMAPEQADGKQVTSQCDLYSLGCVMYSLLSGRPPFRASGLPQMLHLQRFAEPEPVGRFAPETPRELERIVDKLLAKDPRERFANAAVLGRRLEAMERGLSLLDGERKFSVGEEQGELDPLAETRIAGSAEAESAPARSTDGRRDAAPTDRHDHRRLTVSTGANPQRRFTTVEEEHERERQRSREDEPSIFSAQTVALIASLLALAGIVWYFLQPASADTLYRRIDAVAVPSEPETLLRVQGDIEAFVERFGSDPRADEIRGLNEELELWRAERRMRRLVRRTGKDKLLPVERAYLEAASYVSSDPDRAMTKLRALVTLYDDGEDQTMPARRCVELAKRQLADLAAAANDYVPAQRELLVSQLERAGKIAESDPAKARAIYQSVIELHGDKSWANDLVTQAKEALARKDKVQVSAAGS
ncbi:MAG: serine/threonine-protein kinase [Pirellulales bacterium]